VIITGTSLKDMSYTRQLSKFKFLLSYDKPVLAICGGMQILCMINGCCLVKGQEIGLKTIIFNAEYLGAESTIGREREVYALHNMAIKDDAVLKKMFHVYSKTEIDSKAKIDSKNNSKIGCIQAVKHKYFKHYGILFHPEVRNKDMITNFLYV
jgi:GMP synthase (glutamine-hydrolysing)